MSETTDNIVRYDEKKKQFYTVTWFDTGNNEIPTRHYIDFAQSNKEKPPQELDESCLHAKRTEEEQIAFDILKKNHLLIEDYKTCECHTDLVIAAMKEYTEKITNNIV